VTSFQIAIAINNYDFSKWNSSAEDPVLLWLVWYLCWSI